MSYTRDTKLRSAALEEWAAGVVERSRRMRIYYQFLKRNHEDAAKATRLTTRYFAIYEDCFKDEME